MMKMVTGAIMAALMFTAAAPALAQQPAPADNEKTALTMTFKGTVVDDVKNSIRIRQPDGSYSSYIGPVPEYPYKKGDEVSISFSTIVPTSAYYQRYVGQQSADGIYRFAVNTPAAGANTPFGITKDIDVSGPINPINRTDYEMGVRGLVIVYDSNTETYSLEFPNGEWTSGPWDGPGYRYDATTGEVMSAPSTCYGGVTNGCNAMVGTGGFALKGTNDSAGTTFLGVPIWAADPAGTPGPLGMVQQYIAGLFDLNISGGWSVTAANSSGSSTGGSSSGNPTQVPEPSLLLLFGAGAGAVMVARRRRRPSARTSASS